MKYGNKLQYNVQYAIWYAHEIYSLWQIDMSKYCSTCTSTVHWFHFNLAIFHAGMRRRNVGLKLCLDALVEDDDESCNKTVSGSI